MNDDIKQYYSRNTPLSTISGNGGRSVSLSSRKINETDAFEILVKAKNGFLIRNKTEIVNAQIPLTGYRPSISIVHANEELNEWKQHQFYVKSVSDKVYGEISLDIAVLTYDEAPNYGRHGMRVIYIWSQGQFIRTAKSIYANSTPEGSQYISLEKLLPIEKPYIPPKTCGDRPDFYNNQFARHPAPSQLHLKLWKEKKAYYKEKNAKNN
jgi:hypothetical protein